MDAKGAKDAAPTHTGSQPPPQTGMQPSMPRIALAASSCFIDPCDMTTLANLRSVYGYHGMNGLLRPPCVVEACMRTVKSIEQTRGRLSFVIPLDATESFMFQTPQIFSDENAWLRGRQKNFERATKNFHSHYMSPITQRLLHGLHFKHNNDPHVYRERVLYVRTTTHGCLPNGFSAVLVQRRNIMPSGEVKWTLAWLMVLDGAVMNDATKLEENDIPLPDNNTGHDLNKKDKFGRSEYANVASSREVDARESFTCNLSNSMYFTSGIFEFARHDMIETPESGWTNNDMFFMDVTYTTVTMSNGCEVFVLLEFIPVKLSVPHTRVEELPLTLPSSPIPYGQIHLFKFARDIDAAAQLLNVYDRKGNVVEWPQCLEKIPSWRSTTKALSRYEFELCVDTNKAIRVYIDDKLIQELSKKFKRQALHWHIGSYCVFRIENTPLIEATEKGRFTMNYDAMKPELKLPYVLHMTTPTVPYKLPETVTVVKPKDLWPCSRENIESKISFTDIIDLDIFSQNKLLPPKTLVALLATNSFVMLKWARSNINQMDNLGDVFRQSYIDNLEYTLHNRELETRSEDMFLEILDMVGVCVLDYTFKFQAMERSGIKTRNLRNQAVWLPKVPGSLLAAEPNLYRVSHKVSANAPFYVEWSSSFEGRYDALTCISESRLSVSNVERLPHEPVRNRAYIEHDSFIHYLLKCQRFFVDSAASHNHPVVRITTEDVSDLVKPKNVKRKLFGDISGHDFRVTKRYIKLSGPATMFAIRYIYKIMDRRYLAMHNALKKCNFWLDRFEQIGFDTALRYNFWLQTCPHCKQSVTNLALHFHDSAQCKADLTSLSQMTPLHLFPPSDRMLTVTLVMTATPIKHGYYGLIARPHYSHSRNSAAFYDGYSLNYVQECRISDTYSQIDNNFLADKMEEHTSDIKCIMMTDFSLNYHERGPHGPKMIEIPVHFSTRLWERIEICSFMKASTKPNFSLATSNPMCGLAVQLELRLDTHGLDGLGFASPNHDEWGDSNGINISHGWVLFAHNAVPLGFVDAPGLYLNNNCTTVFCRDHLYRKLKVLPSKTPRMEDDRNIRNAPRRIATRLMINAMSNFPALERISSLQYDSDSEREYEDLSSSNEGADSDSDTEVFIEDTNNVPGPATTAQQQ